MALFVLVLVLVKYRIQFHSGKVKELPLLPFSIHPPSSIFHLPLLFLFSFPLPLTYTPQCIAYVEEEMKPMVSVHVETVLCV